MALTQDQIDATKSVLEELNEKIGGIIDAREDVLAALRLDIVDDANIQALGIIRNAKIRAVVHANALATLLAP